MVVKHPKGFDACPVLHFFEFTNTDKFNQRNWFPHLSLYLNLIHITQFVKYIGNILWESFFVSFYLQ